MAVIHQYSPISADFEGGHVYWNGSVYDDDIRFITIKYFIQTERGRNVHEFTAKVTRAGTILAAKYEVETRAALEALGWGKK